MKKFLSLLFLVATVASAQTATQHTVPTLDYLNQNFVHNLYIGTVGLGSPGSNPAVTVANTPSGTQLNFTLPQGPQGPAGTIGNWAGTSFGGSLMASLNNEINVMAAPYYAWGDCFHNDTSAIAAAQAAAVTLGTGGLPATLYFPIPPGGCYIVSDLQWNGAPWEGANAGGVTSGTGRVTIRSLPGQDILHLPDVTFTSGTTRAYEGWAFRNINFTVDNSTAFDTSTGYTNLHRFPGRWFDDTSCTSGSAVIYSYSGVITPGDTGQTIVVGGCGATAATDTLAANITSTTSRVITLTTGLTSSWPSIFAYIKIDSEVMLAEVQGLSNGTITFTNVQRGQNGTTAATHTSGATVTILGNLTTTISSVTPGWGGSALTPSSSFQVVTLAATASNTMSAAHTYVSVLGLDQTQRVGNCALAEDMEDGLSSDWTGSLSTGQYGVMENVSFNVTSGQSNNSCAMYTQGDILFYGVDVHKFQVFSSKFGFIQTTTELNSHSQSSAGDWEVWDHGLFFFTWNPWISVNGLAGKFTKVEITAFSGIQILSDANLAGETPAGWVIEHGFECPYTCTPYGDHIIGQGDVIVAGITSGASGQYGYLDTVDSTCIGCNVTNTYVDGYLNTVHANNATVSGLVNNGQGNIITGAYVTSGQPSTKQVLLTPYKGSSTMIGRYTPDFLVDGNYTTPYNHDDLFLWPTDVVTPSSTYNSLIFTDTTSPSGHYVSLTNSSVNAFIQLNRGPITVGTTIPAQRTDIYLMAKCPTATSFSPFASASTSNNPTFTCNTTYQIYKISATFGSGDVGHILNLGVAGANTAYIAWWYIQPKPLNSAPMIDSLTSSNTDALGTLTLSAATSASFTFTGTYSHIQCFWTPKFNPGTATYWDTSSTTQAQITFSSAVSGTVAYSCQKQN